MNSGSLISARQRETAFHAAGQRGYAAVRFTGQTGQFQQAGNPLMQDRIRQTEVMAVGDQVFGYREIGVEVVHLRHHPHVGARKASLFGDAEVIDTNFACTGRDQAEQHFQRGGLAGAVWPQQAEAFAAPDVEIKVAHDFGVAIVLDQLAGSQERHARRASVFSSASLP